MNRHAFRALFFLLLILTSTAHGKGKAITVLAPISCLEWLEGRKADKEVKPMNFNHAGVRNEFWLLGLVTGLNANLDEPDLLSNINSALIFDWMDRYCSQNQGASVYKGAEELLAQISRRIRR